jgi:hypothetical protein
VLVIDGKNNNDDGMFTGKKSSNEESINDGKLESISSEEEANNMKSKIRRNRVSMQRSNLGKKHRSSPRYAPLSLLLL